MTIYVSYTIIGRLVCIERFHSGLVTCCCVVKISYILRYEALLSINIHAFERTFCSPGIIAQNEDKNFLGQWLPRFHKVDFGGFFFWGFWDLVEDNSVDKPFVSILSRSNNIMPGLLQAWIVSKIIPKKLQIYQLNVICQY